MITQSVIKRKQLFFKVLKRNQKQANRESNREFWVTKRGTYREYRHMYTTHLSALSSSSWLSELCLWDSSICSWCPKSSGKDREKSQAEWENRGESLQHRHRNGFPSWENIRVGSSSCFVSRSNVKMIAMFFNFSTTAKVSRTVHQSGGQV